MDSRIVNTSNIGSNSILGGVKGVQQSVRSGITNAQGNTLGKVSSDVNPVVSGVGQVAGRVGGAANAISSYLGKIKSLASDDKDLMTPSAIRDLYLNGFMGDTTQFSPQIFSRLFDEPTYLTFRIEFEFSSSLQQNKILKAEDMNFEGYDNFPEPLLSPYISKDSSDVNLNDTFTNVTSSNDELLFYNNPITNKLEAMKADDWDLETVTDESGNEVEVGVGGYTVLSGTPEKQSSMTINVANPEYYGTADYLENQLGDHQRGTMLRSFIKRLEDIQNNYAYYFQNIEGLGDLAKINPKEGIRIKDDAGIITIKCLEGLDMKITQLMQLYRKVAWDDVYQRWILPDMMRFFTMKIYVSEIRLFHSISKSIKEAKKSHILDISKNLNSTDYSGVTSTSPLNKANEALNTATAISSNILGTDSTITTALNSAGQVVDALGNVKDMINTLTGDAVRICNSAINDVMPTICFECHQCEFVVDDTLSHINSLFSYSKKDQVEPTIKIKVGRVLDKQIFPLDRFLKLKTDNTSGNDYYHFSGNSRNVIDDEVFKRSHAKNARSGMLSEDAKDDIRITGVHKRINSKFGTNTNTTGRFNTDLAYQLFNSSKDMTKLSLAYSVLNQFTQAEALSAATTIKQLYNSLNTGEYAEMIKSAATDPAKQDELRTLIFTAALEDISRSAATTNPTALSALSDYVLLEMEDNSYRSSATNSDNTIEF